MSYVVVSNRIKYIFWLWMSFHGRIFATVKSQEMRKIRIPIPHSI